MKKRLSIFVLIFVMIAVLRLIGFTYGFYTTKIVNNSNSNSVSVVSKYLAVEYLDGTSVMNFDGDYLFPGDSATKEFSVENTGTGDLTYSLFLEDVVNTFERIQDLRYEIYINDELYTDGAINNNETQYLYFDKVLLVGQTDKVKFIFQYATTSESQNVDMNKTISFKFNIDTMKKNVFASTNGNVEFTNNNYQINGYRIYGNTGYNLPSAYQQVEYVQFQESSSTNTNAYIDTGVEATSETKAVVEYSFLSTNAQKVPFGVISENGDFYAGVSNDNIIMKRYAMTGIVSSDMTISTEIKFKLELNKNGLYVDDEEILTHDVSVFDTGLNIYLGAINNKGTFLSAYSAGWMKIYRFKLYESDVLVRDFIPCYRKSDNIGGMYDLVESKFYTSENEYNIQVGGNVTGPTLDNTMKFINVGDYDASSQKYKIPVIISNDKGESISTDIYLDEPLRKVSNYADYIDFEKQVVVRKIGQVNLTNISSIYRKLTNNIRFGKYIPSMKPGLVNAYNVMSEFLPYSYQAWSTDKENVFKHNQYQYHFYVSFSKERLGVTTEDTDDIIKQKANDYIKTIEHNTIYYPLAKEEIIPINLSGLSLPSEYNKIQVNTAVIPSNVEINYYAK